VRAPTKHWPHADPDPDNALLYINFELIV
jgi:hypothetical protein